MLILRKTQAEQLVWQGQALHQRCHFFGINAVPGFQIIKTRKGRLLEPKQGPGLQQQIAILRVDLAGWLERPSNQAALIQAGTPLVDRLIGKVTQGVELVLELAGQSRLIQYQALALLGQQADALQLVHFARVQVIKQ
ncbi:hypothetical protein D3C84_935130 [compost metagenome]